MYQQHVVVYTDDVGSDADLEPVYDDLDDGPIFDDESFVDPVFDDAPDSNHTAATVLDFATSVCTVQDQDDPDDLDDSLIFDTNTDTLTNGPVFNIETDYNHVTDAAIEFTESVFDVDFTFFDKGLGDLSPAHTGDVLDGDLLFGKEPEIEDVTSFTNQAFVTGVDAPATSVDTLFTCSMKFFNEDHETDGVR
jgi:hypothetical protein